MNPLHLIWIIPLSLLTGIFVTAVLIGGTRKKYEFNNDYVNHHNDYND